MAQQILSRVYMYAREDDPDHTKVEGWSDWTTMYSAPAGWKIASVRPSTAAAYSGKITTHGQQDYFRPGGEVVEVFSVWGDRDGDEAGSWTRLEAQWREQEITLEELAPAWLR